MSTLSWVEKVNEVAALNLKQVSKKLLLRAKKYTLGNKHLHSKYYFVTQECDEWVFFLIVFLRVLARSQFLVLIIMHASLDKRSILPFVEIFISGTQHVIKAEKRVFILSKKTAVA